ncbi:MAG: CopG family transcriptional regulator [Calditrichaeota bacterium]|nr:MAG: CopG family transcriptional regulator [Calditrichota bacterium]MBL1204951.1 CopG family transcriptional regulator [Calditrichota bacterium]NOG44779.1 CopG family transcriptional regulator [Calditrichota bacterium]
MGQITIYIEPGVEKKTRQMAKKENVSLSKWITKVISEKISNEWPPDVVKLAGAWKDFPSIGEIRNSDLVDSKRENL